MTVPARRIALIGSSGGGAATLSAENTASSAIATLREQLANAGLELSAVQFVECKTPLDLANDSDNAALWVLQQGGKLECVAEGSLSSVNVKAEEVDAWMAGQVRQGSLDGMIMTSISIFDGPTGAEGVNAKTLLASVEKQLPCVGTGGTGIGKAYSLGANLISGGGSVSTTTLTRSIAFTSAFAAHWGVPYSLGIGSISSQLHSTLDGCLPIFLGLYACVGLQRQPIVKEWLAITAILPIRVVNTVVTTVTAHEVAKLGAIGIVAGAAAAGCLESSSVPSDLLVGIVCGTLLRVLLPLCFRFGLPATAASIVACGLSGLTAGLLGKQLFCEVLANSTHSFLSAFDDFLAHNFWLAATMGAGFGCLMYWGSQHGLYHVVFLPMILVEMQYVGDEKLAGGALLGALDEAVLAVASAGTLLAVVLQSSTPQERKAAKRGFWINVAWGDFIEAGYPYMQGILMQGACYVCSAASGSIIFAMRVRSSAYLPLPMAVLLSNKPYYAAAAFNIVFVGTFIARMSVAVMEKQTDKKS